MALKLGRTHPSRPVRPQPLAIVACQQCDLKLSHFPRPQGLVRPTTQWASASTEPKECPQEEAVHQPVVTSAGVDEDKEDSVGVRMALGFLRFYKTAISPLLPPACRFLPTCSAYAMDAYRTYGVSKGTVLTAWRLMRCNPFGGSGYDPVRWPPPGLEWIIKD